MSVTNPMLRKGPRHGDAESIRPPVDDHAARAAARIAAIRENLVEMPEGASEFDFPLDIIPPGWVYAWRSQFINQQENVNHMMGLKASGWEYVPASRHPELMPAGHTGAIIERKGLVLMELPKVLSDERRAKEKYEADRAMSDKKASMGEAPAGTMERDPKATVVTSRYEAPIPED